VIADTAENEVSMMRSTRLAVVGLVVGVVGGFVGARAMRDAHADERPTTTTIFVGTQGLVFRTVDGRAIARLSSDSGGGVLELLDSQEQPRSRLRAAGLDMGQGARAPQTTRPPPVSTSSRQPRVDLGF
jgi:hypothetical protein